MKKYLCDLCGVVTDNVEKDPLGPYLVHTDPETGYIAVAVEIEEVKNE